MALSNAEVIALAARLGHTDLNVAQTPRGHWRASCSCGMQTTNRRTAADAAGAAVHHLQIIVRDARTSGMSTRSPRGASNSSEGKGSIEPAAASNAA